MLEVSFKQRSYGLWQEESYMGLIFQPLEAYIMSMFELHVY